MKIYDFLAAPNFPSGNCSIFRFTVNYWCLIHELCTLDHFECQVFNEKHRWPLPCTAHGSLVHLLQASTNAIVAGRASWGPVRSLSWFVASTTTWLVVTGTSGRFFKKKWEFHHPNWGTHIFQRGWYTTNQLQLMIPRTMVNGVPTNVYNVYKYDVQECLTRMRGKRQSHWFVELKTFDISHRLIDCGIFRHTMDASTAANGQGWKSSSFSMCPVLTCDASPDKKMNEIALAGACTEHLLSHSCTQWP